MGYVSDCVWKLSELCIIYYFSLLTGPQTVYSDMGVKLNVECSALKVSTGSRGEVMSLFVISPLNKEKMRNEPS